MESHYESIMKRLIRRLLTLVTGIFLAVALMGCQDPVGADIEAEHLRLGNIAKQQLQQVFYTYPPTSEVGTFRPAP